MVQRHVSTLAITHGVHTVQGSNLSGDKAFQSYVQHHALARTALAGAGM